MEKFGETIAITTVGASCVYTLRHVTHMSSDGSRLWVESAPHPVQRFTDSLDVQRGTRIDIFILSHVREIRRVEE